VIRYCLDLSSDSGLSPHEDGECVLFSDVEALIEKHRRLQEICRLWRRSAESARSLFAASGNEDLFAEVLRLDDERQARDAAEAEAAR
jgi:hypothetical protein